jgi:hypothetical protein
MMNKNFWDKATIYVLAFIVLIFSVVLLVTKIDLDNCQTDKISTEIQANQWKIAYNHFNKTDLEPIIRRLQPKLDGKLAERISNEILKYSSEYRLPPNLVIHVMNRESGFRPLITSKAGALGLMQVIPKWHKEKLEAMKISKNEVYHIDNNVKLGCWILREYFDQSGDIEKTLKKYVGGNHEVYIKDILIGFANEAIVGVKDVQGVPETEGREQNIKGKIELERSGEHEEESPDVESSIEPG